MFNAPNMKSKEAYREEIKNLLPFEMKTAVYDISKLSPSKFQKKYPGLQFVAIPLTDGLYWRFTTQEDLNIFKNYRITHTRE